MRRLALAATLLFASPSLLSAADHDQLRAGAPVVGQAISRLPSKSINGTLNHISSLLEQGRVADLPAGSGDSLPAGFDRQMSSALERLERDLERGLPALQIPDRLILAQVVAQVAFDRNVALPAGPESLEALERIADIVAGSVREGLADWEQRTGADLSRARAAAAADPSSGTFRPWVEAVVINSLYIPGVEHIDGRS